MITTPSEDAEFPESASRGESPRRALSLPVALASVLIPFCLLAMYWARFIRKDYFPYGDEFSIIVNSTRFFHPRISSWFLEGFSKYFYVYPEWTLPYTNFLRPMVDASYYFCSVVFGSNWSWYLLLSYAFQSGIVALSVRLAYCRLGLPMSFALGAGALCFLSPAFGGLALFLPSCGFDLLAALFVLLGINSFLRCRFLLAGLFFSLGVFTKETALFAPVAAAAFYVIDFAHPRRRPRWIMVGYFLLPILAWLILRLIAFPHGGGVYVFGSTARQQLVLLVHGILSWPMGSRSPYQPEAFRWLFGLANGLFWAVLAASIAAAVIFRHPAGLPSRTALSYSFGLSSRNRIQILLFCAGSIAMPVFLRLDERFGAAFYPLFYLTILCVLHDAPKRLLRVGSLLLIFALTAINLFQRSVGAVSLDSQRLRWALSADYVRRISSSDSQTIFVMDDLSEGFSAPGSVETFAGYTGAIVPLVSLDLSGPCPSPPRAEIAGKSQDRVKIYSNLPPDCGAYAFYGTDPQIVAAFNAHMLQRDTVAGRIRYMVPAMRPLPPSLTPSLYGSMSIEITGAAPTSTLLIADIEARRYREVHFDRLWQSQER